MTRLRLPIAAALALAVALAPGLALARVGGGGSMGSRGGFTYSAPPSTGTAPYSAAPMQRSFTPRAPEPSYGSPAPAYGGGYSGRSAFSSGLLGGLVGAGIGGMLFGHGMFGGMSGGSSIIGLLIQLALIFFIGRWVLRLVMGRQPMFAGFGGFSGFGGGGGGGSARSAGPAPRAPNAPPITITPADYAAFEQLLKAMQIAWSRGDLAGLRTVATPEMVGYFNEQMSELSSRGVHNIIQDVRLEKGDLAQAWSEGSREYATVAMKFSMLDWLENVNQEVVDGSPTERQVVTEIWTFVRAPGGRWMLSAIQQTR